MSVEDRRKIRGLLGKLQWLAVQSRPDLCFEVNSLLAMSSGWVRSDIIRLNKLVRRVQSSLASCALHFIDIGPMEQWRLVVYADSSFNNLPNNGTQAGYLIFLVGVGRRSVLLNWKSHKLRRIVRSTLCAETISMVNALEDALLCKNIFHEISQLSVPIYAFSDNKSLVETVYSTKIQQDKRLMVEIASLRSLIENSDVEELKWVPTDVQLADSLTKICPSAGEKLAKSIQNGIIPL